MITKISKKRNSYAENVQRLALAAVSRIVRHMEWISLSISANSVARSLNGSVGAILIFANRVIRSSVVAIMCPGSRGTSYQNAKVETVR